jgi:two-component system cell cycle response regulator
MILFERVVELLQATYKSSITDGLTGLYNRRFWFGRVAQHVAEKIGVSVIFTDIDNFKKLNDTQGHHMGDAMLKQVAEIIMEECESVGIAGRYGGEELVALITDRKTNVAVVAENVRRRVETETIVTISVGYSQYVNGVSAAELIKQADDAMYHSKTTGKNKVTGYVKLKQSLNTK